MATSRYILALFAFGVLFGSCQKDINVVLPETEPKLVVEGSIEPGQPPIVLLTRTQGFFEPTDLNSIGNVFVEGAQISVSDGVNTVLLDEICSQSLPPALIPLVAEATGLSPDLLLAVDICAYTILDPATPLIGAVGKTYSLEVQAEGNTLTSISTIPNPVALDTTWFQLEDSLDNDSLGLAWAILDDPDTTGNFYRWMARRINRYPGTNEVKDPNFIAPFGSAFTDQFFNGIEFEFFAFRGAAPNSDKPDDQNAEEDLFKVGDTVVVRFLSINEDEYEFYRTFENNVISAGDLFTTPANVRSNIEGGLGIWAGLGVSLDTIICLP